MALSRLTAQPDHVPKPRFTDIEEKPPMSKAEADAILAANVKGYAAPQKHETANPPMSEMKSLSAIQEESWGNAALGILGWSAALFLGGSLAGIGIITGMRAGLRWWMG